jgi:hypothetical protein
MVKTFRSTGMPNQMPLACAALSFLLLRRELCPWICYRPWTIKEGALAARRPNKKWLNVPYSLDLSLKPSFSTMEIKSPGSPMPAISVSNSMPIAARFHPISFKRPPVCACSAVRPAWAQNPAHTNTASGSTINSSAKAKSSFAENTQRRKEDEWALACHEITSSSAASPLARNVAQENGVRFPVSAFDGNFSPVGRVTELPDLLGREVRELCGSSARQRLRPQIVHSFFPHHECDGLAVGREREWRRGPWVHVVVNTFLVRNGEEIQYQPVIEFPNFQPNDRVAVGRNSPSAADRRCTTVSGAPPSTPTRFTK